MNRRAKSLILFLTTLDEREQKGLPNSSKIVKIMIYIVYLIFFFETIL